MRTKFKYTFRATFPIGDIAELYVYVKPLPDLLTQTEKTVDITYCNIGSSDLSDLWNVCAYFFPDSPEASNTQTASLTGAGIIKIFKEEIYPVTIGLSYNKPIWYSCEEWHLSGLKLMQIRFGDDFDSVDVIVTCQYDNCEHKICELTTNNTNP